MLIPRVKIGLVRKLVILFLLSVYFPTSVHPI